MYKERHSQPIHIVLALNGGIVYKPHGLLLWGTPETKPFY